MSSQRMKRRMKLQMKRQPPATPQPSSPKTRLSASFLRYLGMKLSYISFISCSQCHIFTDRINAAGGAIASVRLSVRPIVSSLSLEPTGR